MLATRSKLVTNEIAYRLNFFYFVVFFVGLVDLHSYYMTHFTESITTGYAISLWTTSITLALIVLIINEARNASKDPIITESVRSIEFVGPLYAVSLTVSHRAVSYLVKIGRRSTRNSCSPGFVL